MRRLRARSDAADSDAWAATNLTMAANAPEIVLLPGLDGTGDLFDRVTPFLAEDLNVSIVRYPQDPTLGYAGYTELVRNAIGKRKVFLLGELFSGPVAVRVAKQLGEQIKGIVLAATFVKNPWPGWLIRRAANVDPTATPAKIRNAILMGPYGDAELTRRVDEIVRTLPRPVRAARFRAMADVDVRDDFARAALSRPRASRARRLAGSQKVDAKCHYHEGRREDGRHSRRSHAASNAGRGSRGRDRLVHEVIGGGQL